MDKLKSAKEIIERYINQSGHKGNIEALTYTLSILERLEEEGMRNKLIQANNEWQSTHAQYEAGHMRYLATAILTDILGE